MAPSGESLRGDRRPGVVDWSGGVFASSIPRVQLYVNACNGWPQFALQHHWLLPINCHFLRLYSAAGRGIAAVSSAIEESDLYLLPLPCDSSRSPLSVYRSCDSLFHSKHFKMNPVSLTKHQAAMIASKIYTTVICSRSLNLKCPNKH